MRVGWALLVFVGGLGLASVSPSGSRAAPGCTQGVTLNVVAHQDDDILFLSPHLLHDIHVGRCVRTVFVTAGDAGQSAAFWLGREAGSKAAYAYMAGVASTWTQTDAGVSGHPIPVFTLASNANISLAFMRLADGAPTGVGNPTNKYESLQKLWQGAIPLIHAVDGSSGYSNADLTNTLVELMTSFQPDQINTQDYVGTYGDGDNSDHHAVAYFSRAAHQRYTTVHAFTGFQDYATQLRTPNVVGADFTMKQKAFQVYGQFDSRVCGDTTCSTSYANPWLQREYTVGSEQGGTQPTPPMDQPVTPVALPVPPLIDPPAPLIDQPAPLMDPPPPELMLPAADASGGSDGTASPP